MWWRCGTERSFQSFGGLHWPTSSWKLSLSLGLQELDTAVPYSIIIYVLNIGYLKQYHNYHISYSTYMIYLRLYDISYIVNIYDCI